MIQTITSYTESHDIAPAQQERLIDICALRLIEILTDTVHPANLSAAARSSLGELQENMRKQMTSVSLYLLRQPLGEKSVGYLKLLQAWRHYVALSRWIGNPCTPSAFVAPQMIAKLLSGSSHASSDICIATHSVFVEECVSVPNFPLEAIPAVYVSLCRLVDTSARGKMIGSTAPYLKRLSVDDFSSMCTIIADGVGDPKRHTGDVPAMLEFSVALLHHAPHGASRSAQQFMGSLIATFTSDPIFTAGSPALLFAMLKLLSVYCSEFAISLRHLDVENMLSILGRILNPSKTHNEHTSPEMFQAVTTILATIMRLRRDLLVRLLPHLVHCLSRLILCLRHIRPYLGGQQRRIVMDSMPNWISADQPLSAVEAQALSRLLETLAAKTTIRSASDAPQKAESLANPFSKHAVYVLKVNIDAVNDVLCTVPLDIRTELNPGLFVLCEMISEHNRDALMVSALDAGGKTTLKALWKEYEAQKYVGKG
jgi:hypothetical protein